MNKVKHIVENIADKEVVRDEDGRVIIDMTVADDSDFLSPFSGGKTAVISESVADFLENATRTVLPREELNLRIASNCIDEEEKSRYSSAIKEYYSEKFRANEKEYKFNNFLALSLAVLGVLVLTLAIFLSHRLSSVIWSEVVDIVAWVFLWEAVDIKCFRMREMSLKRKRYAAFIDMKIDFIDVP